MKLQCNLHTIYFASLKDNEDDILEVISNLHIQGAKFGQKKGQTWRKIFLKVELAGVYGVCSFLVWVVGERAY